MSPQHLSRVDWSALAAEKDRSVPLPRAAGQPPLEMLFRRIPAGEFRMGTRAYCANEEPRHRVVIPRDFWLGKFVVTQSEWNAVVKACSPEVVRGHKQHRLAVRPSTHTGKRRPATDVSWGESVAWCEAWAAFLEREKVAGWKPGWRVGLPSEAQWEYACRAGSETEYWNGDGVAALSNVGWFDGNAKQPQDVDKQVVSHSREEHPAGLVGMHGNVWEWCEDAFDEDAYRKREDPWTAEKPWAAFGEESSPHCPRALRGGCWFSNAWTCRSSYRDRASPDDRDSRTGFRVCLALDGGTTSGVIDAALSDFRKGESLTLPPRPAPVGKRPPKPTGRKTEQSNSATNKGAPP